MLFRLGGSGVDLLLLNACKRTFLFSASGTPEVRAFNKVTPRRRRTLEMRRLNKLNILTYVALNCLLRNAKKKGFRAELR